MALLIYHFNFDKIITKQTNIFGSESETSTGSYYYQYKDENTSEEEKPEEDNTEQDGNITEE